MLNLPRQHLIVVTGCLFLTPLLAALVCSESQDPEDDRILEAWNTVERLADAGELITYRAEWIDGHAPRFGVVTPVIALDRLYLEILDCNGDIIVARKLGLHANHGLDPTWSDSTHAIPLNCINEDHGTLHYRLTQHVDQHSPRKVISKEGSITIQVTSRESIEQIMETVSPDTINQLLRDECFIELIRVNASVVARIDLPLNRIPDDIALGAQMIVIADKQVIATRKFFVDDNDRNRLGRFDVFLPLDAEWTSVAGATELSAIIIAESEYALRDFDRTRFWNGGSLVRVGIRPAP